MKRLRFDNDTIYFVSKLALFHDYQIEPTPKAVRRAIRKVGEDIFPLLFPIKTADIHGQSDYKRSEKLGRLEEIQKIYEEVLEKKECVSLKMLAVTEVT